MNITGISGTDQTINGTTIEATVEANEPESSIGPHPKTVWYKFTPPVDMTIRFDTCTGGDNEKSTFLALYMGGAGSPPITMMGNIAFNEVGCTDTLPGHAKLTYDNFWGGYTYWLAVSDRTAGDGGQDFQLHVASAPVNLTAPTITKWTYNWEYNQDDTWSGSQPIDTDYQWQLCDSDGTNCDWIDGATGISYQPTEVEIGKRIKLVVTASNSVGTTYAESSLSGVITLDADSDGVLDDDDDCPTQSQGVGKTNGCPLVPVNVDTAPQLSGTPKVGLPMTMADGAASSDSGYGPATSPSVESRSWSVCPFSPTEDYSGCPVMGGVTGNSYTPVAADAGKVVVVSVSWSNGETTAQATVVSGEIAPTDVIPNPTPNLLDLTNLKFPKKASVSGIVKKKGKFTIKSIQVPCPAGGADCKISLTFAAKVKKKTKKLGSSSFTVPAGQTKPLTGKFSSAGVKLIKTNKKLKVTIAMKGSGGGAGKATFKEFTVTK